MCGIAGCIRYTGKIDQSRFDKMVDVIAYRGPDDRGTFYEGDLALGHRRLSIIDLSADGHQPLFFQNRYVVVYNGEIYNYIELRTILEGKGYQFSTKTDTEVLVAAYSYWGDKCVEHLNGMWAFAIFDREEQRIFCSRDRFGVKPFYYTKQEEMFLFASEIKQFFEMLEGTPKANQETLLQFIIRGHIDYSEETMFQDIYQLPSGYNLIFDLKCKTFHIVQYFDIREIKEGKESYAESCENFRDRFLNAVDLRLRSDVPVGYCLSGGLDSSAIVCVADRILKERKNGTKQHTISSCFEDKRYDEQEYIDEVVQHTDVVSHKIFPQESNLFERLDEIIWHMDEPFGSTSIYAQWNVFRASRDCGLKVMLDGQGSDEQLAGYTSFYAVMVAKLLKKGHFLRFWKEWNAYKHNRAVTEQYISTKGVLLSALSSILIPDCFRQFRKMLYVWISGNKSPFSKKQLYRAFQKEPRYPIKHDREFIAQSMQCGMSALLHYEDRNSMAHSIESRVPFLDCDLVKAIYAMPFDHKLRGGITKSVLRDGLRDILPDKIRNRYSKLGFVTPEDQWINQNHEKYREELEKAAKVLSGILDPNRIMEWFDGNDGKVARRDFTFWRIICAGHWVELFHVSI